MISEDIVFFKLQLKFAWAVDSMYGFERGSFIQSNAILGPGRPLVMLRKMQPVSYANLLTSDGMRGSTSILKRTSDTLGLSTSDQNGHPRKDINGHRLQ
jgi:hypothetical protein